MTATAETPKTVEAIGMSLANRPTAGTVARAALIISLLGVAVLTPGFLSRPSLISLANSISLVGCISIAMTFITLSGNVISLSLAMSASLAGIVFMSMLNHGFGWAALAAIAAASLVNAFQGWIIGWLRANPIIVSLAAYALLAGVTQIVVGPKVDAPNLQYQFLKQRVFEIPLSFIVFALLAVVAQLIITFTKYGRELVYVGSNAKAAEAAGVNVTKVVTLTYLIAGAFVGIGGIFVAARFGYADLQTTRGFEFTAIAAVLIGGSAIGGGRGSVIQTFIGMAAISVINSVALLQGLSMEFQKLTVGLAVIVVIVLQGIGKRH